jgi:outer membrane receptor for ferrienterochelin and colicins
MLYWSAKWSAQAGLTLQEARFVEAEEIWSPGETSDELGRAPVFTRNLLRTPRAYGYWMLNFKPVKQWSIDLTGTYTGAMDVPHMVDPEDNFTLIKVTPQFWDAGFRVNKEFTLQSGSLSLFAGIQNAFNQFQQDFDFSPSRDANYIYGPMRPRTLFAGCKWEL